MIKQRSSSQKNLNLSPTQRLENLIQASTSDVLVEGRTTNKFTRVMNELVVNDDDDDRSVEMYRHYVQTKRTDRFNVSTCHRRTCIRNDALNNMRKCDTFE
jgi:hypothetical protein